jgi:hypothetical protein
VIVADERLLPGLVRGAPGMAVLTGGQTGVDTLAARAALRAGLPVHLIFPLGCLQEDGRLTAWRRRALRGASLHELSSDSFRYRTWTLVYLCDAAILLDPAGGEGCAETAAAAACLGRPLLSPAGRVTSGRITGGRVTGEQITNGQITSGQISAWLEQAGARVLLVAGCRASLIASQGAGAGLRAQLTAIAAGASERHASLVADGSGAAGIT